MKRPFWRAVLAAGLLTVVTLAFLGWDGRYAVIKDDVLVNADFQDGFNGWYGSESGVAVSRQTPHVVRFTAGSDAPVPLIVQFISRLEGISHLRVSLDMRTDKVEPGDEVWSKAGVFLYSVDDNDRRIWYWPYEIALVEGTSGWRHFAAVIPLRGQTRLLQLFVFNAGESGRSWVRNIHVASVAARPVYRWLQGGLIGLWGVFACAVVFGLLRRRLSFLPIATCAGAGAIMISLLWPQPSLRDMQAATARTAAGFVHTLAAAVRGEAPEEPEVETAQDDASTKETPSTEAREPDKGDAAAGATADDGSPRKRGTVRAYSLADEDGTIFGLHPTTAAHLAVFVVLAVFARLAFRRQDPVHILIALMMFAAASESIQGFTITRTVELEDWAFNALGIVVGLLTTSALLAALPTLASTRRR